MLENVICAMLSLLFWYRYVNLPILCIYAIEDWLKDAYIMDGLGDQLHKYIKRFHTDI